MSSTAMRAKANREVYKARRNKTFEALKQLFAPGKKWTDLYGFLVSITEGCSEKQFGNCRAGQYNLSAEVIQAITDYVKPLREQQKGDAILSSLHEDVDLPALGEPGDVEAQEQHRAAVERWLSTNDMQSGEESPALQEEAVTDSRAAGIELPGLVSDHSGTESISVVPLISGTRASANIRGKGKLVSIETMLQEADS